MSRALKFTLLVSVQISWILAALYALNATAGPDAALAGALGLSADAPGALRALPWLQYLSIVALTFGVTWAATDLPRPALKALVAAGAVAETFTLAGLLALFGVFFSPWLPALAAGLGLAAGVFYGRTPLGRRRRLVQATFERRVSPAVAGALADGRAPLAEAARGHAEELTVVVCEIINHEALQEALPPADYLARVNAALTRAGDAMLAAGGCLVACDGEGVRAVFGPPLPGGRNHAAAACRAALTASRQVRALNEEKPGSVPLDVRLGVNSGEMVAGRFGDPGGGGRPGGYDAAGEEVAFARRLCAANLVYGSTILLGTRTYELAEGFVEARPLELLRRRPGGDWREVYELLGEAEELSPEDLERRDLFWTGVILYRERRFAEALGKFSQARAGAPHADGPLEFYIRRIEQRQQEQPQGALPDGESARLLNSL